MKLKNNIWWILFFFFSGFNIAIAQADEAEKAEKKNGFLKDSFSFISFSKHTDSRQILVDQLLTSAVDGKMSFSLWRQNKNELVTNLGIQTLITPQPSSNKIFISVVSFLIDVNYYRALAESGRYKLRSFLIHRSQHALDLVKLGIKIPKPVEQDLRENLFLDLNILGGGLERYHLKSDSWQYDFRIYVQPLNSNFPGLSSSKKYPRPLFLDAELFWPTPLFKNRFSIYGFSEGGKSGVIGAGEVRFYLLKNFAFFFRKSFISHPGPAFTTPHQGIVIGGTDVGFFINMANLKK